MFRICSDIPCGGQLFCLPGTILSRNDDAVPRGPALNGTNEASGHCLPRLILRTRSQVEKGMDHNSLYSYLLWRKQNNPDTAADNNNHGGMEEDTTDGDSTSEFGFLRPAATVVIVPSLTPVTPGRQTMARKMVKKAVKEVLVEEGLSEYYADNYRCWPPPLFLIFITLAQVKTKGFEDRPILLMTFDWCRGIMVPGYHGADWWLDRFLSIEP